MAKKIRTAFEEQFYDQVRSGKKHTAAYCSAADAFEKLYGLEVPFSGYNSWRKQRDRNKKAR